MTSDQLLRQSFVGLEVNDDYTEAVVTFRDGSRLTFRHRVGERRARAAGPEGDGERPGTAGQVLAAIALFRLNGKHLDVRFSGGGRWEARFAGGRAP